MNVQPEQNAEEPQKEQTEAPSSQDQQAKSATRSSRRDRKSASAFRTISEVADILEVQQHVLRFWETKFSQVRPLKRGGGRRYYRPEDVALLRSIHHLLYTEGYTIKGVQKLLREKGKNTVVQNNTPGQKNAATPAARAAQPASQSHSQPVSEAPQDQVAAMSNDSKATLEAVLRELKDLKTSLFSDA